MNTDSWYDHDGTKVARPGVNRFFAARREHIWRLRTFDKATYAEIARRLGVSKGRVYYALCSLERRLKRHGVIDG